MTLQTQKKVMTLQTQEPITALLIKSRTLIAPDNLECVLISVHCNKGGVSY